MAVLEAETSLKIRQEDRRSFTMMVCPLSQHLSLPKAFDLGFPTRVRLSEARWELQSLPSLYLCISVVCVPYIL